MRTYIHPYIKTVRLDARFESATDPTNLQHYWAAAARYIGVGRYRTASTTKRRRLAHVPHGREEHGEPKSTSLNANPAGESRQRKIPPPRLRKDHHPVFSSLWSSHRGAEGEVGYKMPVHDVEVDVVCPLPLRVDGLLHKAGHVCR